MIATLMIAILVFFVAIDLDRRRDDGPPAPGWYWGEAVLIQYSDQDGDHQKLVKVVAGRLDLEDVYEIISGYIGYGECDDFTVDMVRGELRYRYWDGPETTARIVDGTVSAEGYKRIKRLPREYEPEGEEIPISRLGEVVEAWLPPRKSYCALRRMRIIALIKRLEKRSQALEEEVNREPPQREVLSPAVKLGRYNLHRSSGHFDRDGDYIRDSDGYEHGGFDKPEVLESDESYLPRQEAWKKARLSAWDRRKLVEARIIRLAGLIPGGLQHEWDW